MKYLGIWLSKRTDHLENLNVDTNPEKCRLIMNNWLQRDITIFGRIVLMKIESLSRLTYPCFSLAVSAKKIKAINKLHSFIHAFSRCFYPKRLTVHSGYTCFCQYMCSLGIEPTTFALLMQCSTTEPQEHKHKVKL